MFPCHSIAIDQYLLSGIFCICKIRGKKLNYIRILVRQLMCLEVRFGQTRVTCIIEPKISSFLLSR